MDVTDGLLNALDFALRFSQMLVHRASVERRFQFLELGIPIEKTPTVDPIVTRWQKAEHWEAERYSGHQHCNRSLCMDGQPQRQMPLHKRRAVFVKIDSRRCNGIFYVRTVRKFAGALKDICSTMSFYHCLQQELDNFWMKIATYQHFYSGSDEWQVI